MNAAVKLPVEYATMNLVKSTFNKSQQAKKRIYINTLIPGFSYVNHKGETVTPRKCILL